MEKLPVVILAGGLGLRMADQSNHLPKALVSIGQLPVIHHVMKIYAHQGFDQFIVCLGYKGDQIKDYFVNQYWKTSDFELDLGTGKQPQNLSSKVDKFNIRFVDTGLNTNTGGRIKKIERFIETDNFMTTYCDGLSDIKIQALVNFHKQQNKIATLTAVHPMSPFGMIQVENGFVTSFKEKPMLPGFINGGFFVFNKRVFDYLDENCVLEEDPLRKLSKDGQLCAYQHEGFWTCMDTAKDYKRLNKLWETGYLPHIGIDFNGIPWKIWKD